MTFLQPISNPAGPPSPRIGLDTRWKHATAHHDMDLRSMADTVMQEQADSSNVSHLTSISAPNEQLEWGVKYLANWKAGDRPCPETIFRQLQEINASLNSNSSMKVISGTVLLAGLLQSDDLKTLLVALSTIDPLWVGRILLVAGCVLGLFAVHVGNAHIGSKSTAIGLKSEQRRQIQEQYTLLAKRLLQDYVKATPNHSENSSGDNSPNIPSPNREKLRCEAREVQVVAHGIIKNLSEISKALYALKLEESDSNAVTVFPPALERDKKEEVEIKEAAEVRIHPLLIDLAHAAIIIRKKANLPQLRSLENLGSIFSSQAQELSREINDMELYYDQLRFSHRRRRSTPAVSLQDQPIKPSPVAQPSSELNLNSQEGPERQQADQKYQMASCVIQIGASSTKAVAPTENLKISVKEDDSDLIKPLPRPNVNRQGHRRPRQLTPLSAIPRPAPLQQSQMEMPGVVVSSERNSVTDLVDISVGVD